ncbi:PilZ domain-containing protein [Rubinisphaera margarita]|uniref:PilZ domain-containing protein n=1 Tax=Rubinisphaera margarita TaxID=2909586 RepID=UPI001EE8B6E1|nr:PilZ domain-containing protein [Rubinisphaera margarita]MCG6154616.1 PilZ domain-containing protein [Rubinisphaera margarita]
MQTSLPQNLLDRRAERAIRNLNRWSSRFDGSVTQRRRHLRERCFIKASLATIAGNGTAGPTVGEWRTVWVRNISAGGIGFLSAKPISEITEPIVIVLGNRRLIYRINRSRPVHDSFYEYGARFIGEGHVDS